MKISYNKKRLKQICIIILIVLVCGDTLFSVYLYRRQDNLNFNISNSSSNPSYVSKISYLIIRASTNLNKSSVVDPITGGVYLVDAKLVLPPMPTSLLGYGTGIGQVDYTYGPAQNGSPTQINVSNLADISMYENKILDASTIQGVMKYVPALQACDRGVTLSIAQPQAGRTAIETKQLSNDQTVYIYPQDSGCSDSTFLKYVEQVNSY